MSNKPFGRKSYGSIAHLPNSRVGRGDHHCDHGQAEIATLDLKSKHREVIVQEKLDGSNVGVGKINGEIVAIQRAGYTADTSPFKMHHLFAQWVEKEKAKFDELLHEGERVCGEWIAQAHGTIYTLIHDPFVAFDIMVGKERVIYDVLKDRCSKVDIITPHVIHRGKSISVDDACGLAGKFGNHGAEEEIEGVVYRIEENMLINPGKNGEREWKVNFLVKYVKPNKIDGKYILDGQGNQLPNVWNNGLEKYVDIGDQ
jgi:hypothetical protein